MDPINTIVETRTNSGRQTNSSNNSDILKMILVNCGGLSFHREYIHVEAHQDECMGWEDLSMAAQLNAACNVGAKAMLRSQDITALP
jgi:hypothetical protein